MTGHVSLHAAAELVRDASTLALGGLSLYRRPVAFVRALLSRGQRPTGLTLLAFTAGYESDLLVGAGCVDTVRTVYFGLEAFGLAPMFTDRVNRGMLNIIEETETSLVMGLRAQIGRAGSLPSVAWQGTDLLDLRPDVETVTDPYTGEAMTAFPAIPVDVAVLHALEADASGNVAINNNLAIDQLLVYAAGVVIVTAEQFVEQVEPAAHKTIIPAAGVDYVAHAPGGAVPTSCYPLYPLKGRALMNYSEQAASVVGFKAYVRAWLGVSPELSS